jgi:hypothetical protein
MRTRRRAYDDIVMTNNSQMPGMYKHGTVEFFRHWYYEAHDEEAMKRWEARIGLGHDPIAGWDNTYQQSRPQYPAGSQRGKTE